MDVKTVVRCYFKTFGDFVTIYSTDVSKDGILVTSDTPLQVGDSVRLEFKLRNDYPLIMGEGQVMRNGATGAYIKFVQLDADSEKFLNEVVKVKAAELKPVPGAPPVTYDAEVVQEESTEESFELDDAFAGIQDHAVEEVEDIDTGAFEDVDTASFADVEDPFSDGLTAQDADPTDSEALDFSGISLNSQSAESEESPFGENLADEPADENANETDIFAEPSQASAVQEEYEQDDESTGYEDVEQQSPANPQALFEDIHDSDDGHAAAMHGGSVPADEVTAGGSTTIFNKVSAVKERKALLIGASIGVFVLLAGGAAWFFMGSGGNDQAPASLAAVEAPPVAQQVPPVPAVVPVTATANVAPVESTAAATQLAPPVVAAPVAAPAPTPAPVPAPAPAPAVVVAKAAAPSEPRAVSKAGPATKIVEIEVLGNGSVLIRGDGAFQKVKHFTMSEPNRIIVDVYGVSKAFKGLNRTGTGAIARIRPGEHEGKIRFVLDMKNEKGKIPAYDLSTDGEGVLVSPGG